MLWSIFTKTLKALLPRLVTKKLRPFGHGLLSVYGNYKYGRPSDKLIVVGVTGTNGKSTTVNLIVKILEQAGHRVGFFSTVNYSVGREEKYNTFKMTTVSGLLLQNYLAQMVKNGCTHAVLEISSEGLAQNRHLGINFDVAVFTNLTPEHLESHGGFENYKRAKEKLFTAVSKHPITPAKRKIYPPLQKTIVANLDDEFGIFYLNHKAGRHVGFSTKDSTASVYADHLTATPGGISFNLQTIKYQLQLKGLFDVYNAIGAIATSFALGATRADAQTALANIPVVEGRMEIIQSKPYTVLVDYAPEPYSLQALYDTIAQWPKNRLIHVLGSTGGGRDKARRKTLGEMAGRTADLVIVTNEDPYDDDPGEIIHEVAQGAESVGKTLNVNLFRHAIRREGIRKALALAQAGDLVLVTGKGSEQKMAVAKGKYIDWDDRKVIREELENLGERNAQF